MREPIPVADIVRAKGSIPTFCSVLVHSLETTPTIQNLQKNRGINRFGRALESGRFLIAFRDSQHVSERTRESRSRRRDDQNVALRQFAERLSTVLPNSVLKGSFAPRS